MMSPRSSSSRIRRAPSATVSRLPLDQLPSVVASMSGPQLAEDLKDDVDLDPNAPALESADPLPCGSGATSEVGLGDATACSLGATCSAEVVCGGRSHDAIVPRCQRTLTPNEAVSGDLLAKEGATGFARRALGDSREQSAGIPQKFAARRSFARCPTSKRPAARRLSSRGRQGVRRSS